MFIFQPKNKDQTEFSNEKPDEEMNKQIECQQNATNKVNIDKKCILHIE